MSTEGRRPGMPAESRRSEMAAESRHPASGVPGLRRDVAAAARDDYDLIVIGGGIYGAMTTLEAARRGLRPLLIERDDFGAATSWNSHRIVHGGLRYLQRFDLGRFRTSVRERRWFLTCYPDLVEPLTCLMPLYGQGLRRPEIMRAALAINHLLSRHRNDGVRSDRRLESGGVMTSAETRALFPGVRAEGLCGGALWYDAVMTDSQRLLMEALRWACAHGARCLNYVEATSLETRAGDSNGGRQRRGSSVQVAGVRATDRAGQTEVSFRADTVINCAGPWSAGVAHRLDDGVAHGLNAKEKGAIDRLFRPSLAFNLLFACAPPSSVAVAVSAPERGSHTWFLYPRRGYTYVGTAHYAWDAGSTSKNLENATRSAGPSGAVAPSDAQIEETIENMNAAIPGLGLERDQLVRVHAGLLPAKAPGSTELADRPEIHDHGAAGGAAGLWSVSGVKYTTARAVAETALRRAFPSLAPVRDQTDRPAPAPLPDLKSAAAKRRGPEAAALLRFAEEEAVVHADDLLSRRGPWADDPRLQEELRDAVAEILTRRR